MIINMGDVFMTSFLLKIIGAITMLCDHIGSGLLGKFSFFNLIGRFAFPIFAFQSVLGYINTKNFNKHLIKLFIFACISQIPFILFLSTFTNEFVLNIFFCFFLGLLTLFLYDKCKNKILGFLFVIISSIISELLHIDYGAFGILLIFAFYFFKDKKVLMIISIFILCFANYIPNIIQIPSLYLHYLTCAFFTSLSVVFILFYNKKEGPKAKYFFYIFYPLHLLIIYIISSAL